MPRSRKVRTDVDDPTRVTNLLFEVLKKRGEHPLYAALRKRINDISKDITDWAEIELVCLTIIDDSHDFTAWREFNWLHYEKTKESLEVPDGAWVYALWSYHLGGDKKLRESVNFWLGKWFDGTENGDNKLIEECKEMLDKLWLKHHAVQEIGW